MIDRARRAFPGMLVSMLLAAPAFAAPTGTNTTAQHHTPTARHVTEQRRPIHRVVKAQSAPRSRPAKLIRAVHVLSHPARRPLHHAAVRHNIVHHVHPRPAEQSHITAVSPQPEAHLIRAMAIARPLPRADRPAGTWQQTGMASWYGGKRWVGHATSSGERYDENQLTAAHATLPLGSRVRVTILGTGRSVVVTINDRPGTRTRIIDLSRGAAAELGMLDRGIAKVTLALQ